MTDRKSFHSCWRAAGFCRALEKFRRFSEKWRNPGLLFKLPSSYDKLKGEYNAAF